MTNQAAEEQPRARIAVIVGDPVQPRWVARVIRHLLDGPAVDVWLLIHRPKEARGTDCSVAAGRLSRLLYGAFERFDRRSTHAAADPAAPQDLRELIGPERTTAAGSDDRLFTVGFFVPAGEPGKDLRARFDMGIISVLPTYANAHLAGAAEVLTGSPVLEYDLLLWRADEQTPTVVHTACVRTNRLSVSATATQFYFHLTRTLAKRLASAARRPERVAPVHRDPGSLQKTPPRPEPSSIAASLSRMAALRIEHGLRARLQQEDWALAVCRPGPSGNPLNIDFRVQRPSIMLPPEGSIWADPFPVKRDGRTYILFEEMDKRVGRGNIALMELTEQLEPRLLGPVLSASYHLSYPFTFEWRGSLFMLPETEQNRTIELYRCVDWPDRWTLEGILLDRVSATDATLVNAGGKWWLFTTMNPTRDTDWDTDLYLFHADTPLGPWTPHTCNPVKSDVRSARSAGRMFWQDGRLYRPSQDCAARYGHAIMLNEITRLTMDRFEERTVRRIDGWQARIAGVHTLNQLDDVLLVDCKIRRRKRREARHAMHS